VTDVLLGLTLYEPEESMYIIKLNPNFFLTKRCNKKLLLKSDVIVVNDKFISALN
jgi:hypothetical protein